MWSIGAMPRVSDMGELSETTMVKGVAECSACGGSGGVVELMTGWGAL